VNLDHRILILAIVVWIDGARRTDHLNDIIELIHFGPVGSIKTIGIPKVDICSMSEHEFHYLFESISSGIVKRSEPSFVSKGRIGAVVKEEAGDLIVVLFNTVVKGSFLSNIMIFLSEGRSTLRLTSPPYFTSNLTKLIFWIITAIWRGLHPFTLRAFTSASLSS
jgi:hypothetical protein